MHMHVTCRSLFIQIRFHVKVNICSSYLRNVSQFINLWCTPYLYFIKGTKNNSIIFTSFKKYCGFSNIVDFDKRWILENSFTITAENFLVIGTWKFRWNRMPGIWLTSQLGSLYRIKSTDLRSTHKQFCLLAFYSLVFKAWIYLIDLHCTILLYPISACPVLMNLRM